jgi:hypothetical protein
MESDCANAAAQKTTKQQITTQSWARAIPRRVNPACGEVSAALWVRLTFRLTGFGSMGIG